MKKFWLIELLIISERSQVHCYMNETMYPIVEKEATTFFSKEWSISYVLQEKQR